MSDTRVAAEASRDNYPVPLWARKFAVGFGKLVAAPLLLWAVAAGMWRALDTTVTDIEMVGILGFRPIAAIVAAIFYAVGGFASGVLIVVAAGLIGGAFGFLFGLPRMEPRGTGFAASEQRRQDISGAAPANGPAAEGEAASTATARTVVARTGFRMSPALNEIADWLTKIIVGVGLVQARDIGDGFAAVMHYLLRDAGLVRFPAAGVMVPACMIIGLIGGFILCYLVMTLVVGPQLARAADDLETVSELREKADRAKERADEEERLRAEAVAETARIEGKARERAQVVDDWRKFDLLDLLTARSGGLPPVVSAAAREFAKLDFGACATLDEKLAWAKINAALGQQERAFEAYEALQENG